MKRLTLRLMGPVELTGPAGEILTPRGMRARAALAILGSAKGMRVTRARLQDLLFSERDPEHGNASVRQLLREIRIALRDGRDALATGPGWVGFDTDRVEIDLSARPSADGQRPEFAADLDVPDAEFEDWLREARAHAEAHISVDEPAQRHRFPNIVIRAPVSENQSASIVTEMVLGDALGRVVDLLPIQISSGEKESDGPAIIVASSSSLISDVFYLVVKLIYKPSGAILWAHRFSWPMSESAAQMQECAAQICLAAFRVIDSAATVDPTFQLSFGDIFSFSKEKLIRADQNLGKIDEKINPAVVFSLRAWIRNTLAFERLADDPSRNIEEAQEYSRKAREISPLNSTVVAVSSFVEGYLYNLETAKELARQAIALDRQNPIARLSYSRSLYDMGKFEEASVEARASLDHPFSNLNPANWHVEIGLALTKQHQFSAAARHMEVASYHAPDNRPALRFLSALRYHLGDERGAMKALQDLKKLEPDFTLDLMGSDTYPVDSLRNAGLLRITKSGLI